jgi:protein TonB
VLVRAGVVVLAHIVAVMGLAQLNPELRSQIEPVLVSLIALPQPEIESLPSPRPVVAQPKIEPKPKVEATPKIEPKPVAKRPVPASPARSRKSALPVEHASATRLDRAAPTVPAPAAPSVEPVSTTTAVAALPKPPLPVIAPRFDVAYLHNPRPEYPRIARRLGEHGRVTLQVFVSPVGLAEKVEVSTSSGYSRLDEAARDAVRNWQFVPARRGEQAVGAWVLVPITFVLEG